MPQSTIESSGQAPAGPVTAAATAAAATPPPPRRPPRTANRFLPCSPPCRSPRCAPASGERCTPATCMPATARSGRALGLPTAPACASARPAIPGSRKVGHPHRHRRSGGPQDPGLPRIRLMSPCSGCRRADPERRGARRAAGRPAGQSQYRQNYPVQIGPCGLRAKTATFPGTTTDARIGRSRLPAGTGSTGGAGRRALRGDRPAGHLPPAARPAGSARVCRDVLRGEGLYPPAGRRGGGGRRHQPGAQPLPGRRADGLRAAQTVVALNMVDLAQQRGLSLYRFGSSRNISAARVGGSPPAAAQGLD